MPRWNLATQDRTLVLDVEAYDDGKRDGSIVGTIIYQGTLYFVSGGWAASGPGRAATAFSLTGGPKNENQPSYISAAGIMIGPSTAPAQINIRVGVSDSANGNLSQFTASLVPYIAQINGPGDNPYQTGEIPLQSVTSRCQITSAIFNDTLFARCDSNILTFDLRNLIKRDTDQSDSELNTDALKDPAKWIINNPLPSFMPTFTLSRLPFAATPEALYLFFINFTFPNHVFAALTYSIDPSSQEGKWLDQPIQLGTSQNTNLTFWGRLDNPSDVSTTVIGDNVIIYAAASPLVEGSQDLKGVYLAIYDTRDVPQKDDLWVPGWDRLLPLAGYSVSSVMTEWFSTVGDDGKPEFYLAVYGPIAPAPGQQPTGQTLVWYIPLTVTQDKKGGTVVVPAEPTSPKVMEPQVGEGDQLASLVRDPAGRLRAWGSPVVKAPGAGILSGHILETLQPLAPDRDPVCPRVRDRMNVSDNFNRPTSLFYVFAHGQTQTTVNNRPATEYPVYEFVFYDNNPKFQVIRYGSLQQLNNYQFGGFKQKPDAVKYIIGGIIDGPIPVPLENYVNYPLTIEPDAGTLTYGSLNTKITSRKVSNKWTVGFKSSGKAISGFGPAWDISLNGGMGSVSENSVESTLESGLNISAKITPQQGSTPPSINQNGTLLELAAQYSITAYRFLDRFGKLISDSTTGDPGESQKAATIATTLQAAGSLPYTPIAVTPGNLNSYTPEAWNKRMHDLGYREPNVPDDKVANYYGNVIFANAYPFAENAPYLEFSWSGNSNIGEDYKQFTSAYTENSWSLDGEFYVGVSGGEGVSIFGLGEDEEFEFMVGASYSHESTESQNKESEWCVKLEKPWGPVEWDKTPNPVVAYAFRLFFLPVPKPPSKLEPSYWTQELKQYMQPDSETKGDEIDVNSGCWRIVFVVTNIQYRDPNAPNSYQYSENYLDTISVYQQ